MKLTMKQAVATLNQLEREHQIDLGAANGVSRAEVEAKMAGSQPMDKEAKEIWHDVLYAPEKTRSVVTARQSADGFNG